MKIKIVREPLDSEKEEFFIQPEQLDVEMVGWEFQESKYDSENDILTVYLSGYAYDKEEHAFLFHIEFEGKTIFETDCPEITFEYLLDFIQGYEEKHNMQFVDSTIHYHPVNNHFYLELID